MNETPVARARITPYESVPAGDGGWWTSAKAAGYTMLIRLDRDGNTVASTRTRGVATGIVPMADGGAVSYENGDDLIRVDAGGGLVWASAVLDSTFGGARQPPLFTTPDTFWTADDGTLRRFSDDGVERLRIPRARIGFGRILRIAGITGSDSIIVVGEGDQSNDARRARMVRLSGEGRIEWESLDPTPGTEFTHVVTRRDDVVAVGKDSSSGKLLVTRAAVSGGALLHRSARIDIRNLRALALDRSGHPVVVDDDAVYSVRARSTIHVTRLGDDGAAVWRTPVPEFDIGAFFIQPPSLVVNGAGDDLWLVLASLGSNNEYAPGVVHLGADGAVLSTIPRIASYAPGFASDGDGGARLMATENWDSGEATVPPDAIVTIARDGRAVSATLGPDVRLPLFASGLAVGGDGATYVAAYRSLTEHQISRRDVDGTLSWSVTEPGVVFDFMRIDAAGDRVCMFGHAVETSPDVYEYDVACYRTNDGTRIWRKLVATSGQGYRLFPSRAVVDSSGDVTLHYRMPDGAFRRDVFDRAGTRVSSVDLARPLESISLLAAMPHARTCVAYKASGALRLEIRDRTGNVVVSAETTEPLWTIDDISVAPDGRVAIAAELITPDTSVLQPVVYVFDAAGRRAATLRLPSRSPHILSDLVLLDDAVVMLDSTLYAGTTSAVTSYRIANGAMQWRTEVARTDGGGFRLVPDASRSRLAAINSDVASVRTTIIEASSGEIASERYDACSTCDRFDVRGYGESGLAMVSSGGAATTSRFDDDAFVRPVRLPIAESDIEGIWLADYLVGQGFFIDVDRSRTQVFMPWFTFADRDTWTFSESTQRWFTIQGDVAPGATTASLPIYRNAGGEFTSETAAPSVRVGTAEITFESCRSATLRYRFDDDSAGFDAGAMSLTRVAAPATCAVTSTATPAPGMQSGTWFEPRHAGQGVLLDLRMPGTFLGAWFAYDRAGFRDDHEQHWFTLQGAWDTGSGVATVPIYETVGGAFDYPAPLATHRVGEATFRLQACDRIDMSYRFDASDRAGAFRGQQGEIMLRKFDGCD